MVKAFTFGCFNLFMRLVHLPFPLTPFQHAALEEWLVRNADCEADDLLLLYTNRPCVVVGKNQSVFKEINISFLLNQSDAVVRRVSGGGAVYHDEGNLNFATITKFDERKLNNYALFNSPIKDVLNALGVPAEFNQRNDIIANGKKISGNAQFTNRKNIISHGTILVNSNLENLRNALKQNSFEVQTKAVSSVRSSVANVSECSKSIVDVSELKSYLINALCKNEYALSEVDWKEVLHLAQSKYATYEWRFGRSPESILKLEGMDVVIKDGLIAEVIAENKNAFQKLKGIRFSSDTILENQGNELLQRLSQ
jgi:lipoate-protein ligase A